MVHPSGSCGATRTRPRRYLVHWTVTKFDSVLAQALELDDEERELLAIRLGLGLAETEPGYDEAWESEIQKRLEELDRGQAQVVDWDEAQKLIFDD